MPWANLAVLMPGTCIDEEESYNEVGKATSSPSSLAVPIGPSGQSVGKARPGRFGQYQKLCTLLFSSSKWVRDLKKVIHVL